MKKISRRNALKSLLQTSLTLTAGMSLAAIMINCNDDNGDSCPSAKAGGDCDANGTDLTICENHGHTMTVTAGEITTGTEIVYNIQGSSGHSHTVTLTAAHFTALQGNQGVEVRSTTDSGHSHTVVVNCA
jgi:hypothetical protein